MVARIDRAKGCPPGATVPPLAVVLLLGLGWFGVQPAVGQSATLGQYPVVISSSVNGGALQRSMVTSITTVFDRDVHVEPTSLSLRNLTTGSLIDPATYALAYDAATHTATWTFSGLPGGSLPDGNYVGTLLANGITSATSGTRLDGNGDGRPGDSYSFDFYRYYGDVSGDRDVDFADTFWFQRTYLKNTGDPLFDSRLDADGNGKIDAADLSAFQKNYLSVLAPQPGIFAGLVNDTGLSATDGLTADPTIAGAVVQKSLIAGFQARLDDLNVAFQDVLGDLQPNGTFWFSSNRLATIKGAALADGPHTLFLQTVDAQNKPSSTFALQFVLDTTPPALTLDLDPASDSPPVGDLKTTNELVTLVGQTEPSLTVTLMPGGKTSIADGTGHFSFTAVPLALGTNLFTGQTVDLAGNHSTVTQAVVRLAPGPCLFDDKFTGWTVSESGGWSSGHGQALAADCSAAMTEGDSFVVTLEHAFTITNANTVLSFTYTNLSFDTSSSNTIKDAFEAALVDAQGNPLVFTIVNGRDAFFNVSEGQPAALAAGVSQNGTTVSLDLSALPTGTAAKLIFRLVNNDQDRTTSVVISDVKWETTATPPAGGSGPVPVPTFTALVASDFGKLSDVTASVVPEYGQTSFNGKTHALYADLSLRNAGSFLIRGPVVVVVTHLSDPSVHVLSPDGLTPDGSPYYNFAQLVRGVGLLSGQLSGARTIAFLNPIGIQFSFDLVVLGQLNHAPSFTSTPVLEALVGKNYAYDALAIDPDGDPVTYSLLSGPPSMTINSTNGHISWQPGTTDIGNKDVRLLAVDGHAGSAEQRYVLAVISPPPNRPPVFSSLPVVEAFVNIPYSYQATATDPDGDIVVFSNGAADAPVAYWRLGESGGNVAVDSTGNGDNGTYTGALTLGAPGAPVSDTNTCVQFNGGYVNVPESSLLRPSALTVEAWVKAATFPDWATVLTKTSSSTWGDGYGLAHYTGSRDINFFVNSYTTGQVSGILTAGVWNYLVGTYDGTTLKLYINGILVASRPYSQPIVHSSMPLRIGSAFPSFPWQGLIDEVAIYDKALPPETIQAHFLRPGRLPEAPPQGVTIDSTTGTVRWLPTRDQLGPHKLLVQASDGRGGIATQPYVVTVLQDPNNHPPVFVTTPITHASTVPDATGATRVNIVLPYLATGYSFKIVPTFAEADFYKLNYNDSTFSVGDAGFGFGGCDLNTAEFQRTVWPADTDLLIRRRITLPAGARTLQVRVAIDNDVQVFLNEQDISGGLRTHNECPSRDSFVFTAPDSLLLPGQNLLAVRAHDRGIWTYFDMAVTCLSPTATYLYAARAIDPDNDPVTYRLLEGPSGMTIGPTNGLVNWDAGQSTTNLQHVIIEALDNKGGFDQQSFNLEVIPPGDLVIGNVDKSAVIYDGQLLTASGIATATVTNQGPGQVDGPFDVLFFEDRNLNGAYDSGIDGILGTTTVTNSLLPGQGLTISATLGGAILFPENTIWAFVDSSNVVFETNEGNNYAHTPVSCQAQPIVGQFNPVIKWRKNTFDLLPESTNVCMMPVVIDLNRGGRPAIVFSTFKSYSGFNSTEQGCLRAVDGATGRELWSATNADQEVRAVAGVAAADIDGDSYPEIIAVHKSGGLIAFEHDGRTKWVSQRVFAGSPNWGCPTLADPNGDGKAEIIFGSTVLTAEGTVLWEGTASGGLGQGNNGFGPISIVADLDLDGRPEVIAGRTAYRNDGSVLWNAPIPDGFAGVANFDSDPFPEVVVVAAGNVYLLAHDGTVKWGPRQIPGGGEGGPPTIADLDGDGHLEIGVAGAANYVVFDSNGLIKWYRTTQDLTSRMTGSSVFDFDGDGSAEVVYGDEVFLRIYRGSDGTELFKLPKSSVTTLEYPVIADVDGDGKAEIVASANCSAAFGIGPESGLYVIGDANNTWVSTRKIWNQHSYHITNVNDDGTIPAHEANSWQLYNTYRCNYQTLPGGPLAAPNLVACYLRVASTGQVTSLAARVGNAGEAFAPSGINVGFYNGDPRTGGTWLGKAQTTNRVVPGAFEDVSLLLTNAPAGDVWVVANDGLGPTATIGPGGPNAYISGAINWPSRWGQIFTVPQRQTVLDAYTCWVEVPPFVQNATVESVRLVICEWDGSQVGSVLYDGTCDTHNTSFAAGFDKLTYNFGHLALKAGKQYVAIIGPPVYRFWSSYNAGYSGGDAITDYFGGWHLYPDLDFAFLATFSPPVPVRECEESNNFYHIPSALGYGEIHGRVFNDVSGNGILDSGEPLLVGRWIYLDQNQNGVRDVGEISVLTDSNGAYGFLGLAPGTYFVMQELTTGFLQTLPTARGYAVSVTNSQLVSGLDFGSQQKVGPLQNHLPVFATQPPTDATVGQLYRYDASASDADGDSLRFDLVVAPSGLAIEATTGVAVWTPSSNQAGTNDIVVRVSDGRGGVALQSFQVLVKPANSPPVITPTPTGPAMVGNPWQYQMRAQDADGNPITFKLDAGPNGMGINPSGGLVTWTPAVEDVGTQHISVTASDDQGASETQSFDLPVVAIAVNHPPVITSQPPASVRFGDTYLYPVKAFDPDGDPLTFSLTVAPLGMTIDSAGFISWPTQSAMEQVNTIQTVGVRSAVTSVDRSAKFNSVTNGTDLSTYTEGELSVTIPGVTANEVFDQFRGHGEGSAFQWFNQQFDWVTIKTTEGALMYGVEFLYGNGYGSGSAPPYQYGYDGDLIKWQTYKGAALVSEGSLVLPVGTVIGFRNPSGFDRLLVQSVLLPGGNAIAIDNLNVQMSPGVEVRVEDGRGGVAEQGFGVKVLTVAANHPPLITSAPSVAATVGENYKYDVTAIDPDGDPLVWRLTTAPNGMSIDSTLGTIRWTPTVSQLGTNEVVVHALDSQGGFATQSFTVVVRLVNLPPQIVSAPPTIAAVNQLYTYSIDARDPEFGPLSFSLMVAPTNMVIDPVSGLIQWTPTEPQLGTNDVVVRVTDCAGAFAEQNYSVVVTTNSNHYPVITSTPAQYAIATQPYQYQVTATDADGEPLVFALLAAPSGMGIDPNRGLVLWTPSLMQTGLQQVVVGAVDPHRAGGSQSFQILVTDGNHPPQITSHPLQVVTAGLLYRYDVQAIDADGDPLTYSLTGPSGMTIDNLGRVTWSTSATGAGTNHISITVTDSKGASVLQDYDLVVVADTTPPFVRLGFQTDRLPVGSILDISTRPTDNVGIRSFVLMFGGVPVPLDANGNASLLLARTGVFQIVAVATDLAGNVGQDQYTLTVFGVNTDPNGPQINITSPANDEVVTRRIDVLGTVQDANLVYYTLEVGSVSGGPFREIARGSNSVVNGVLGKLDASMLANDTYTLRLTATDADNNLSTVDMNFSVAGELKVGNFRLSFTDLSIPVNGVPITVGRSYDSLNANEQGSFGFGWRLEFRDANLRNNLPPRTPEEIEVGIFRSFSERTRVYITVPGGRREAFTFQPVPMSGWAGSIFGFSKPTFVADPGVTSQLTVPAGPEIVLQQDADGNWNALAADGGTLPYNPDDPLLGGVYTLTTKEGMAYQIDAQSRKLTRVIDPNGNTLSFTDAGISSSTGVQVTMARDPQGRITAVTDPAGQSVRYRYDTRGDLVEVTDRQTNITHFVYSSTRPHYLEQVVDPLGHTGVRTEYNDQGRLVKLIDAAGNPVQLIHDPDNSIEQVVDSLEHTNTFVYDGRGNVVTEVNALGGVTRREYDLANNMTQEVDALDHTNRFTYDGEGNVLTRTDPLGNKTIN